MQVALTFGLHHEVIVRDAAPMLQPQKTDTGGSVRPSHTILAVRDRGLKRHLCTIQSLIYSSFSAAWPIHATRLLDFGAYHGLGRGGACGVADAMSAIGGGLAVPMRLGDILRHARARRPQAPLAARGPEGETIAAAASARSAGRPFPSRLAAC